MKVDPDARALASSKGIDLSKVKNHSGVIYLQDVQEHISAMALRPTWDFSVMPVEPRTPPVRAQPMFPYRRPPKQPETTVFILAAGLMDESSYSWNEKIHRHLLPIAGEPLIRRSVRLVRRFGHDAVVVTKTPYIAELFRHPLKPANDYLLWDTMLSTRKQWAGRVIFIQGDYFLYDDFLERVFSSEESCRWEVDHGVAAVVIAEKDHGKYEEALKALLSGQKLFQDCMSLLGFKAVNSWYERSVYDFDNAYIWNLCKVEQPWVLEDPKPVLLFLAAGRASRLSPISDDLPKCLLEFQGKTLAERVIDEFVKYGLSEIVVSVGHHQGRIQNCLGSHRGTVPIAYIFNPDYERTGSGTSITLARERLWGHKSYIYEGDQVLDPFLIQKMRGSPYLDCLLVDNDPDPHNDPGVWISGREIVEGVTWRERPAGAGNAPYFLKLSEGGTEILTGVEDDGGVESLAAVADRLPVHVLDTDGLPWAHINTPGGLEHARAKFGG